MVITLSAVIIWILIAILIGFIGELLARRRAPFGIIGAIVLGFIAIFLVVGILGIHIAGDPTLNGVPIITSIIVAAVVVAIWSAFAHRRAYAYYSRYYRRPRRRFRWF